MPDTLPNPSCHACGAPIALGEPVAIYHLTCDRGPAVAAAPAAEPVLLGPSASGVLDSEIENAIDRIVSKHEAEVASLRAELEEAADRNVTLQASNAGLRAVAAQRAALQTIMQILGPTPPASAECCPGCSHEINEALRVLRDVGIEYQPRKGTR